MYRRFRKAITVVVAVALTAALPGLFTTNPASADTSTSLISGFAGGLGTGRATDLSVDPSDVATDAAGNVYIADSGKRVIRKIDTSGNATIIAGNGEAGNGGNGGLATAAQFFSPSGIALDSNNDVIVSDRSGGLVRLIAANNCASSCPYGLASTSAGHIYNLAGGGPGTYGFQGLQVHLSEPVAVRVDSSNNLFVVVKSAAHIIAYMPYASCSSNCGYNFSNLTAGFIYMLAGYGAAGAPISGVVGYNSYLNNPNSVTVDANGNVIIADTGNHQIRIVPRASCASSCDYGLGSYTAGFIYGLAGTGAATASGNGGPASTASFASPIGVEMDAAGNLLITDDQQIRMVANATCAAACAYGLGSTTAMNIYGIAGYGGNGDGAAMSTVWLSGINNAVHVATNGDLFITSGDTTNVGSLRIAPAAACASSCPYGLAATSRYAVYTVAGNGTGVSGQGQQAANAELSTKGLTVDSNGNVIFVDRRTVRMVAASNCASACSYSLGSTVAGNVYALAGSGSFAYSGDGGPALAAGVPSPERVTTDSAGNLFISDSGILGQTVRMVAASTCLSNCPFGLPSTTKGNIYAVAGTHGVYGSSGDNGPATSARLFSPSGMRVDTHGNLLIADTSNSEIRMVAATTCAALCDYGLASTTKGYVYTIAGTGSSGSAGDGTQATSAQLSFPKDVYVDAALNVLIADTGNGRIKMIAGAGCASSCAYGIASTTAGSLYTVAGGGAGGNGVPATSMHFSQPESVAVDSHGNLLIADSSLNYLHEVAFSSCASGCAYGVSPVTANYGYVVSGTGLTKHNGDGGSATAADLYQPRSIAVDASDNVYLTNDSWIREITTQVQVAPTTTTSSTTSTTAAPTTTTSSTTTTVPPTTTTTVPSLPPSTNGYRMLHADGSVSVHGSSAYFGDARGQIRGEAVTIAATRSNNGYWIASSLGEVRAFGDAVFFGSTEGTRLNAPVINMAVTPTGNGYWMLAKDGGVFTFGDARFYGSTGSLRLNQPAVGMAPTDTGNGYWFVASDGGIFSFGDAQFYGSMGGTRLNKPVVGMTVSTTGHGYRLVATDGGIFSFGDAQFYGSLGSNPPSSPVQAMQPTRSNLGYYMVSRNGGTYAFGDASHFGNGSPTVVAISY